MSADNWRTCPQCLMDAQIAKREQSAAADAAYGKVPAEEYERMITAARETMKLEETLREDYHIGMLNDGELHVQYSCSCRSCGFKFEHTDARHAILVTRAKREPLPKAEQAKKILARLNREGRRGGRS